MRFIVLFLAFLLPAPLVSAQAFDTTARAAWVYDMTTGTVLLEKNADEALPPASMSKLMTLYMLFEAVQQGRLGLDDRFTVSTRARQMGGSTMFLNEQDRPTVAELIRGIIVLSGNDASVVAAEGMAGTEEAFAREMNARAPGLGLTQSHFANSSGWPHRDHLMSARDLGVLAVHLIRDFPEFYGDFALREFAYDGRAPANRFNRNPLLALDIGADGLKTGHSTEAGYGLVASAEQGGRRIVFVLMGLDSERSRANEAERLAGWAFREFAMHTVVPGGETVVAAPVWLGDRRRVGLTTAEGVRVLLRGGDEARISAVAQFNGPIPAPIRAGQVMGDLVITLPGGTESRTPLIAAEDVAEAGVLGRLQGAVLRLGAMAWQAAWPGNG